MLGAVLCWVLRRGVCVQALATMASLLGVEEAVLEKMLTKRVVKTRGEVFEKKLEVQDANLTRDAIVKSLYEVGGTGRSCARKVILCVFFYLEFFDPRPV